VLYLLDSCVLIDAHENYYPIDRVPEYWNWLIHQGQQDNVKICQEMLEEITGDGLLPKWLAQSATRAALLLPEQSDPAAVQHVVDNGYASDLTDVEIITVGRDPFLIAHAMTDVTNRCVVTSETSAPSKTRQNRKVPDVCDGFAVSWCDPYNFVRQLDFRTNWQNP
jgi:hypothetical protein